jgi:hypothetical protein
MSKTTSSAEPASPFFSSRVLIMLLSLSAALVGLLAAAVALLTLPDNSLSLVGVTGATFLVRGIVFRSNMSASQTNGWLLTSMAVPFCVVLLPGGLQALALRGLFGRRAVLLASAAQLSPFTHSALRGVLENFISKPILAFSASTSVVMTIAIHRELEERLTSSIVTAPHRHHAIKGNCLSLPIPPPPSPSTPTMTNHHEE